MPQTPQGKLLLLTGAAIGGIYSPKHFWKTEKKNERSRAHAVHQTQFGDAIADHIDASSVRNAPAAFLASLIANESGGNPNAKRFESHVLVSLWQVLVDGAPSYGSIGRADLAAYVGGGIPYALTQLDDLVHSHGLTQIMGWHVLEENSGLDRNPLLLYQPARCLAETQRLLRDFARQFSLD